MSAGSKKDKLDNGYPFRDDLINFYVKYNGKKYYFEFPVLMDRSFLLREIKNRTGVRGSFSLRWSEWDEKSQEEKEKSTKLKEKPERFAEARKELKGEEICIHSSYLTTLSLHRFCGFTLTMVDRNERGGDASWGHFSQIPLPEYNRKLIEERRRPFDCPP